jgi:hypothetical protein
MVALERGPVTQLCRKDTVKLAALVRADAHLALAVNAGGVVAARVVRSKAPGSADPLR